MRRKLYWKLAARLRDNVALSIGLPRKQRDEIRNGFEQENARLKNALKYLMDYMPQGYNLILN